MSTIGTTKRGKVLANINDNTKLAKHLLAMPQGSGSYGNDEMLHDNLWRYVQAVKQGRMFMINKGIDSKLRHIVKPMEVMKGKASTRHMYFNFTGLFMALGYKMHTIHGTHGHLMIDSVQAVHNKTLTLAEDIGLITEKMLEDYTQLTPELVG